MLSPPDRRNLLNVRERLWQGRAVLLAGAGVSRAAARPLHPHAPPLPLWHDLAGRMADALYDGTQGAPPPLRLAQEYETAFGAQAILDLVTTLVADTEHVPGPLHEALLGLPWGDVFTTNYDTLLERTIPRGDARYEAVYLPSDLSRRRRPRIVKLHGSLPSHLPLVLTEEDFRTYPETRAPFTALVHAALAEDAVVLLGFSYDDPNFLAWSGWVRDRLGPHAPPIHLVGALDLPAHRRQLLESRGVQPVDLGQAFPVSDWPDSDQRHRAALAWVVASLEAGEPPHPLDWLSNRTPTVSVLLPPSAPDPLPPGALHVLPAPHNPKPRPVGIPTPAGAPTPEDGLNEQRRAWRRERLAYPGWVVAPIEIQRKIEQRVVLWGDDVRGHADALEPPARLGLLREYAWRHRVAGIVLSEAEIDLCEHALSAVNPAPSRLDLPEATVRSPVAPGKDAAWTDLLWADIADDWADLALSVLENVRRMVVPDRFDRWAALLARLDLSPAHAARLHHERCRMALAQLDLVAARTALDAWPREPAGFPFERTWQACIQAEVGDWTAAHRSASDALALIRLAQAGAAQRRLALVSQEAWTRQLLALTEQVVAHDARDYARMRSMDFSWQRGLSDLGANPRDVLSDLETSVAGPPPPPPPTVRRRRHFDPGHYRTTQSISFGSAYDAEQSFAGQRALAVQEEGGIPHARPDGFTASELSTGAAAWARLASPYLALSVELHADTEGALEYLSRSRLGALAPDAVERIYGWLETGVAECMDRLRTSPGSAWKHPATRRTATLVEAMSRFVFRLDADRAEAAARLGLDLLGLASVQRDYRLHKPAGNLVARAVRALPPGRQAPLAVSALSLPLPGLDVLSHRGHWPNAGATAWDGHWTTGAVDLPTDLVGSLLRALSTAETSEAREHAFWRLAALDRDARLSEAEREAFAAALLNSDEPIDDAPFGIRIRALLPLPTPVPERLVGALRTLALDVDTTPTDTDFQRLSMFARPPGIASDVDWSLDEVLGILSLCERWYSAEQGSAAPGWRGLDDPFSHARDFPHVPHLLGSVVMTRLPPDHPDWDRVDALIGKLHDAEVPVGRALPFLLRRQARPAEYVATRVREALASPDLARFEEAAWGVADWMIWAGAGGPAVPPDVIDPLVYAVSAGRDGHRDAAAALTYALLNPAAPADSALLVRIAGALLNLLERSRLPDPEDALVLPPNAVRDDLDLDARSGARLAAALLSRPDLPPEAEDAAAQWTVFGSASPFPDVREVALATQAAEEVS